MPMVVRVKGVGKAPGVTGQISRVNCGVILPHFWGMAKSPFLPIKKTLANGMIDIELDAIKI